MLYHVRVQGDERVVGAAHPVEADPDVRHQRTVNPVQEPLVYLLVQRQLRVLRQTPVLILYC